MIGPMLLSVLLCLATMAGLLFLFALVVRMQVRRFNAMVARDRLDDWELALERLDPAERERARANPPAAVLAAMVNLPSRGRAAFFTGWDERPLQVQRRRPVDGSNL